MNRFQFVSIFPHGYASVLNLPVVPEAGPIILVTGTNEDDHFALYKGKWIRTWDCTPASIATVEQLESVAYARSFRVN